MNVLLTLEDSYAVMMRMTGMMLDKVELSDEGRDAIREWRKNRTLGTKELDDFVLTLNDALGNHIDDHMKRRIRLRGGMFVTEKEATR